MTKGTEDPRLFQFLNEIGIIDQLARAKMESVLPDGLRMSQFIVLNHLVRLGGQWSPARLASAFQVTKGAMTNTIKRLETRGLIRVLPDPNDGRGKLVELTRRGARIRDQCIQNVGPLIANLESEFGKQRISDAIPLLQQVRQYLDEHRD